jgi:hypothetical protein
MTGVLTAEGDWLFGVQRGLTGGEYVPMGMLACADLRFILGDIGGRFPVPWLSEPTAPAGIGLKAAGEMSCLCITYSAFWEESGISKPLDSGAIGEGRDARAHEHWWGASTTSRGRAELACGQLSLGYAFER